MRYRRMEVFFYLIPVTLILILLGVWGVFWSIKRGQFDDLDGASERILFDNEDSANLNNLKKK